MEDNDAHWPKYGVFSDHLLPEVLLINLDLLICNVFAVSSFSVMFGQTSVSIVLFFLFSSI